MIALVLGATGHIGQRLVPALTEAGHAVRAMARSADPGLPGSIAADVLDRAALDAAMAGVDVVYHLIHSLSDKGFAEVDERVARAVADAAERAGVRQIVYLGGPRPPGDLSPHLASRAEVGDVFLACPVPALVLRASMVIGPGSASYELLALGARATPIMLKPAWMSNRSRPIAVTDVLGYLVAAMSEVPVNAAVDIGGPDVLTYSDLIQRYARVAGLPWRVPVPLPSVPWEPAFAAAAALAPLPSPLVRALLESLRHDLVPDEVAAPPPGGWTSVDRALRAALGLDIPAPPPAVGTKVDRKVTRTGAPADALWRVITGIGGDAGWHTIPGVWTVRGLADHAIGGVGLHHGRTRDLQPGDTVDAWTVVERDDANRRLILKADMRLPGEAWLTMTAFSDGDGSRYEQRVDFRPTGLAGRTYWYAQRPAHDVVFGLMARGVARAAERAGKSEAAPARAW